MSACRTVEVLQKFWDWGKKIRMQAQQIPSKWLGSTSQNILTCRTVLHWPGIEPRSVSWLGDIPPPYNHCLLISNVPFENNIIGSLVGRRPCLVCFSTICPPIHAVPVSFVQPSSVWMIFYSQCYDWQGQGNKIYCFITTTRVSVMVLFKRATERSGNASKIKNEGMPGSHG